ncbi:MAG TPA: SRPBCC family protein [Acidimicrobiales bacterium]
MAKPQHVHEIYIRTTPERLWEALTDPELTSTYYYGCAVESTWEAGAVYRYVGEMGPAITGEIVEVEPPRRLVMTFTMSYDPEASAEPPSTVTWEITPVGDELCRLTLTHSDFGGRSKTWVITLTGWTPIISGLKTILETGQAMGPVPASAFPEDGAEAAAVDLDAEWHRSLGIDTNQEVWTLLGKADRTPAEDETMVCTAYASAYHWSRAARRTEAHAARGEWMISHVHVVVGQAAMAQHHAQRCMAVVEAAGLEDFDLAYAHEAMARAAAARGRPEESHQHRAAAAAVPIADGEDRKIFDDDLAAEPWFGVVLPTE